MKPGEIREFMERKIRDPVGSSLREHHLKEVPFGEAVSKEVINIFKEVGPGAPPDQQRDLTAEEYSAAVWRVAKEVLKTPEVDSPPELMTERMPDGWGLKNLPKHGWMEENCSDVLPSKYCKVDPDLRRQAAEIRARAQAARSTSL